MIKNLFRKIKKIQPKIFKNLFKCFENQGKDKILNILRYNTLFMDEQLILQKYLTCNHIKTSNVTSQYGLR